MTIQAVRIYYRPSRERLERYLSATHWGLAEWIKRRLKPIREELCGPEVKGIDIVNFMLCDADRVLMNGRHGEWKQVANTLMFTWICDLEPLRDQPPLENIERLMPFCGAWAAQAPWPQARAVGEILSQPFTDDERRSLLPFLTSPRESFYRQMGYDGERLALVMEKARRDVAPALREARYGKPRR